MGIDIREIGNQKIAFIDGKEALVTNVSSALDLMVSVGYETDCRAVVLPKQAVAESFFDLRTGLAGEILQKFVNYQMKLAVVGDFSGYTSKSLKDFIYESNQGRHIFFVSTEEEAIEKLLSAL